MVKLRIYLGFHLLKFIKQISLFIALMFCLSGTSQPSNINDTLLSRSEKEKIRTEERFRKEVRDDLSKNEAKSPISLWEFFNSPFGVSLFSTVIVASLGWIISTQWNRRKERKKVEIEIKSIMEKIALSIFRARKLFLQDLNMGDIKVQREIESRCSNLYDLFISLNNLSPQNINKKNIENAILSSYDITSLLRNFQSAEAHANSNIGIVINIRNIMNENFIKNKIWDTLP